LFGGASQFLHSTAACLDLHQKAKNSPGATSQSKGPPIFRKPNLQWLARSVVILRAEETQVNKTSVVVQQKSPETGKQAEHLPSTSPLLKRALRSRTKVKALKKTGKSSAVVPSSIPVDSKADRSKAQKERSGEAEIDCHIDLTEVKKATNQHIANFQDAGTIHSIVQRAGGHLLQEASPSERLC
jgi:hypothetical protein